jgi:hypothetical protein
MDNLTFDLGAKLEELLVGNRKLKKDQIVGRINHELKTIFEVIGYEQSKQRTILTLFDKKKKEFRDIDLSRPSAIKASLAPSLGDYEEWMERIGLSTFGEDPFKFLKKVLFGYCREASSKEKFRILRWGIHILPNSIIFINDKMAFSREYEEKDWKELSSPIFEDCLISFEDRRWSSVTSILGFTPKYPPDEILDLLTEAIKCAWTFVDDVDPWILSSLILAIPVLKVFPREPIVFLTGKYASGKSRFVKGFLSGNQYYMPGLVENACLETDTTGSGLIQKYGATGAFLCFDDLYDEVEKDAIRERNCNQILGILRSSMDSESGQLRGTPSLKPKELYLKAGAIFGSILAPRGDADLSRIIHIELKHVPEHLPPEQIVKEIFEKEGFRWEDLRSSITVGLLGKVEELREVCNLIEKERLQGEEKVDPRFKSGIIPMLSVVRLLKGGEYRDLALKIFESKEKYLRENRLGDIEEDLIETILDSSFEIAGERRERVTLRILLKEGEDIERPEVGFIYDGEKKELYLKLRTLKKTALYGTPYQRKSDRELNQIIKRSPFFKRKLDKPERAKGHLGRWVVLDYSKLE